VHTPLYRDSNIPFTTSSGIHGPQIAEWVVMNILAHAHSLKTLLQWQRDHHWGNARNLKPVRDAVNTRLGVLGYGSIGRQGG
jgi:phosphoglycerate dehydrogenase-like enzyme